MQKQYHALALFSGGLDSILAIKVIEQQGLAVLGLHFTSPFFGDKSRIPYWQKTYDLELAPVDVTPAYLNLLRQPRYGFGKYLNPCIDCKILMVRHGLELLPTYGASFLISGEVIGQRPMSQRKDAMNSIRNMTQAKDRLLRPLCAFTQEPTLPEKTGLVDREKLPHITGRDRKVQMNIARELGITQIPNPGGGCLLTERELARRYAPILTHFAQPTGQDFALTALGRQFWHDRFWLTIGRNQTDNRQLISAARKNDVVLQLAQCPGPVGLLRPAQPDIPEAVVQEAAKQTAWFAPKARGHDVDITCQTADIHRTIRLRPEQSAFWQEPKADGIAACKKQILCCLSHS